MPEGYCSVVERQPAGVDETALFAARSPTKQKRGPVPLEKPAAFRPPSR